MSKPHRFDSASDHSDTEYANIRVDPDDIPVGGSYKTQRDKLEREARERRQEDREQRRAQREQQASDARRREAIRAERERLRREEEAQDQRERELELEQQAREAMEHGRQHQQHPPGPAAPNAGGQIMPVPEQHLDEAPDPNAPQLEPQPADNGNAGVPNVGGNDGAVPPVPPERDQLGANAAGNLGQQAPAPPHQDQPRPGEQQGGAEHLPAAGPGAQVGAGPQQPPPLNPLQQQPPFGANPNLYNALITLAQHYAPNFAQQPAPPAAPYAAGAPPGGMYGHGILRPPPPPGGGNAGAGQAPPPQQPGGAAGGGHQVPGGPPPPPPPHGGGALHQQRGANPPPGGPPPVFPGGFPGAPPQGPQQPPPQQPPPFQPQHHFNPFMDMMMYYRPPADLPKPHLDGVTTDDPDMFLKLKEDFVRITRARGWAERSKKQWLNQLIRGQAADLIRDVDFREWDDLHTCDHVLAEVERKFMANWGTVPALTEYRKATQGHDSYRQWSARLHRLHQRAYPDMDDNQRQNDEDLKFRYVQGIKLAYVRHVLTSWVPEKPYRRLIDTAEVLHNMQSSDKGLVNSITTNELNGDQSAPSTMAEVAAFRKKITCHICSSPTHGWRDCPRGAEHFSRKAAATSAAKRGPDSAFKPPRPPQPKRLQKGRGSGGRKGKKKSSQVATLEERATEVKSEPKTATGAEFVKSFPGNF